MSASIIDGKAHAARLGERITASAAALAETAGTTPGLAVVLVGNDPASGVYVRNKGRTARKVGMASFEHVLPEDATQEELMKLVAELNADDAVDGILVQLPLPAHLDSLAVVNAIDPAKDVDGLHPLNAGRLASGLPGLVSCTPLGCLMLLRAARGNLSGLDAIVVGRSILVGKPVAQLL
ncbi:tetrahydrofolate dehydrogenase/cyclohydrolase catalytic domain-containing protein, partial [Amaricoccus sp.]|uniref:tetrahydrofolate dehydrogenase/cyclohydrolase catalytic domain-containing protein n=1 Tax=Amaricoccus sp. TaxID=1872485 RepID=UPI001B56547C